MKRIDTLIEDIQNVLKNGEGWDAEISAQVGRSIELSLLDRVGKSGEDNPTLRMSNVGYPCERKLWYEVNEAMYAEPFTPATLLTFLYGDIVESLVIGLAKSAGHDVRGEQTKLRARGIVGHRDCVIDGYTIDIKSATTFSMEKFKGDNLLEDDPFGYIGQLKSYILGGKDDPTVAHKNEGGFLAVDKAKGTMVLSMFQFSDEELEEHANRLEYLKFLTEDKDSVPHRGFDPVPSGYKNAKTKVFVPNGNMELGLQCGYCRFKNHCYGGSLRVFLAKRGMSHQPKFFTKVVKEPNMVEVTDWFESQHEESEE